jgi:three-Cys-motif partner protein
MKSAAYYRGREQTYLKHFFLERYLETVAYHIGYSYREFVYVDCFSGPWKADDEALADTSIRIALDKLNGVRRGLAEQSRNAKIKAIFVEKDPRAFEMLQTALDKHRGEVIAQALPGAFEDNIAAILREVGSQFAFFFIDPTGWSVAMDQIAPILRHQRGEVMVNVMFDFINRAINFHPANEPSLDEFFGTVDWRKIREAPEGEREEAIIHLYKEQLRTVGAFQYVTSTRILKPLSDRAYFHLAYATRSRRGIQKFRDVEKRTVLEQDEVRTAAKRDHRVAKTGQSEIAFDSIRTLGPATQEEKAQRLEQARGLMFASLQQGPILFEHLQPRMMEVPLVPASDVNKILMDARREGRIAIEGMRPKERTPKDGCMLRLLP